MTPSSNCGKIILRNAALTLQTGHAPHPLRDYVRAVLGYLLNFADAFSDLREAYFRGAQSIKRAKTSHRQGCIYPNGAPDKDLNSTLLSKRCRGRHDKPALKRTWLYSADELQIIMTIISEGGGFEFGMVSQVKEMIEKSYAVSQGLRGHIRALGRQKR